MEYHCFELDEQVFDLTLLQYLFRTKISSLQISHKY